MTERLINRTGVALVAAFAVLAMAAVCAPGALAQKAKRKARAATMSPPGKPGEPPVIEGALRPGQILNVSPEWRAGFVSYHPDEASTEMIRSFSQALRKDLKVEVIVGTWCGDSRREVPHFLKLQRTLQNDRLPVSFWGVDRTKQNPPEGTNGRNIERVPTFIVYYKGAEIGRITEKPQVSLEADLAEILSKAGKG